MNTFEELVHRMRDAQKRFYAAPSGSWQRKEIMNEAKILETAVDQLLAKMNAPEPQISNQKELF